MLGLQSYNLMVNPKYQRLDRMLFYMRETFGYHDDVAALSFAQNSLTEAENLINRRNIDIQRLMSGSERDNKQVQDLVNHLML